ncbi:MAG: hypothetical protein ACLUFV_09345 [Acutalibacteraceae bacterium]
MPVSHLTLLLSKLAGLYVYELIFLAVLFVPAYITYFIVAGFTVSGLFTLLIGVLFGPLIPLALGLLVAFLFGLVMRRMKRRNIIQIVFFSSFLLRYVFDVQFRRNLRFYRKRGQRFLERADQCLLRRAAFITRSPAICSACSASPFSTPCRCCW